MSLTAIRYSKDVVRCPSHLTYFSDPATRSVPARARTVEGRLQKATRRQRPLAQTSQEPTEWLYKIRASSLFLQIHTLNFSTVIYNLNAIHKYTTAIPNSTIHYTAITTISSNHTVSCVLQAASNVNVHPLCNGILTTARTSSQGGSLPPPEI